MFGIIGSVLLAEINPNLIEKNSFLLQTQHLRPFHGCGIVLRTGESSLA